MKRTYDIIELQKMSIPQLTEVANDFQPMITNGFKQNLIYAILERQEQLNYKPSELNSRDRYADTAQLEAQLEQAGK